jgi:hypothetical protein
MPVATPPATPTPTPSGTPIPTSTPTPEVLQVQVQQDRCATLDCVTLQQGTYIGDNPFEVDESLGSEAPIPGVPGIVMAFIELFNTFAGPHAYVEYMKNQEDNVIAQLTYSQDNDGKTIEKVGIQNDSGQFLKVTINLQNSDGTITQVGPQWVDLGTSEIDLYPTITDTAGSTEPLLIEAGDLGNVKINVFANFNDPPLIMPIEFAIPEEE